MCKLLARIRPVVCLLLDFALWAGRLGAAAEVVGNVRVQALSPTLVRLEVKGSGGFEDRPTFHVLKRDWSPVSLARATANGVVTLSTGSFTVSVPQNAVDLQNVTIADADGAPAWSYGISAQTPTRIISRWVDHGMAYLYESGGTVAYGLPSDQPWLTDSPASGQLQSDSDVCCTGQRGGARLVTVAFQSGGATSSVSLNQLLGIASCVTFLVAPGGNDSYPGMIGQPSATL